MEAVAEGIIDMPAADESVLPSFQEGDWMEVVSTSIYGKIIRYCCNSITNHGQPVHMDYTQWVVLDEYFPRMKVTKISDAYAEAAANKWDFMLCRQKYIDQGKYISDVTPVLADITRKRPYYNVVGIFELLFRLWQMRDKYGKIVYLVNKYIPNRNSEQVYSRDVRFILRTRMIPGTNTELAMAMEDLYSLAQLDEDIQKMYHKYMIAKKFYCTQIWKEMWLATGNDVFMRFYDMPFCTPGEAERFCIDHCEYIDGFYQGGRSNQVWLDVKANWEVVQ